MRRYALALAVVLAIWPVKAAARPPCDCELGWRVPGDGAKDVPTNTRVVVHAPEGVDRASIRLLGPAGEVACRVESYRDAVILYPKQALAPETSHRVAHVIVDRGRAYAVETGFVTGTTVDITPPSAATGIVGGVAMHGNCPRHRTAIVTTDTMPPPDPDRPNDHVLEVEVTASDGARETLLVPPAGTFGKSYFRGDCMVSYPRAKLREGFSARVSVVDVAGNRSSPSPPVEFQFAGRGCQVAAAPGAVELLGLLGLLGLPGLQRRLSGRARGW